MILNKLNLEKIDGNVVEKPSENILNYPEKVLQFGTGVLLRGLPDYFIDKANKQGIFKGRIVIVKSTSSDSTAFDKQDGLFTLCVRGIANGERVEENIINASISRVLSAQEEWDKILECAENPLLKIVISNTTEVGISMSDDKITDAPPKSFPGKLLSFLYKRYQIFNGSANAGMIVLPTELITENGSKLKSIVLELAKNNELDSNFECWLENANYFCNTLVDRIVTGKPNQVELDKIQSELGYEDELLSNSEVFRLWAIEGDEKIKKELSFSIIDKAVVVQSDIDLFKELKLRLLNGTHTFNCGTAFLSGFKITRDAVNDEVFSKFAKKLMHHEIAKAIPYEIDEKVKTDFANNVFERFQNPFIDHQWQSITVQYTSKMKMRNIPLITNYFAKYNTVPICMATGFAAFLLYMKATVKDGDKYFGTFQNENYLITCDSAAYFYEVWNANDSAAVVDKVLSNIELWGTDLTALPEFSNTVKKQLQSMINNGVAKTIIQIVNQNEVAHEA